MLRLHFIPVLGHLQLLKLSPKHIQALYAQKLKEGLSANSVNVLHAILHKAFDHAVRLNLLPRNICDVVSPPRAEEYEINALSLEQVQQLLTFAAPFEHRTWAIESAGGLGKLLTQQLLSAGEHVVDVPPTLSARVRLLGSAKASKNVDNDALATAIAGLRHCGLRAVRHEDHTAVIRILIDRYDDLTALRTQAACRLHVALRELIAGGAPRRLCADRAAKLLRGVHPDGVAATERKRLALELLADVRRLDREIATARQRVTAAVHASATSLLEVHGVGPIVAGFILGHVGDPARFPTADRFASYNGTAPIEASSGPRKRHRLNPRGNRKLNHAQPIWRLYALMRGWRGRIGATARCCHGAPQRSRSRSR
jgi:transposase